LVREVDVQPSHLDSSPHGRRFGFLLFQKYIIVEVSLTTFLLKNKITKIYAMSSGTGSCM
jgi:hypothetical protein